MSKSIPSAKRRPTAKEYAQFRADWSSHHRLATWLAWHQLHWRESIRPHELDEAIAEAVAHGWRDFVGSRLRRPDRPIKTAVRLAIRLGVARTMARVRFVPKPCPNYIDALDRRSCQSLRLDELAPSREILAAPRDTADRTAVEALILRLPAHVQAVARLLSYGVDRKAIARRRGVSRRQTDRAIADLRAALVEIFRAS